MTDAGSHTSLPEPRPAAAQTVHFGIPLKARATAKNWDWTVRDFNRTLASIYNQTNPNFRVLVGCHDVLDLLFPTDERLEFIRVHSPAPDLTKDHRSIYPDKRRKLRRVGERFRQAGGSWFMVLDADDLVSSRLVEFVLGNPNPNGFIVRLGFFLEEKSRAVAAVPDPDVFKHPFDQICGSSAIIRLGPDDFRESSGAYPQSRFARYAVQANHRTLWRLGIEDGRPLTPLPFRAVTYVVNTGENYAQTHRKDGTWRTTRLVPAIRSNAITHTERFREEFAFSHPVWGELVCASTPAITDAVGADIGNR